MPQDKQNSPQLPPHLQRAFADRTRSIDDASTDEASRSAALQRRRLAIQFDIDQGELAQEPDNPWTHRIELLTEALANVEEELRGVRIVERSHHVAVPSVPVTHVRVSEEEPYEVRFMIGDQEFVWQEKLDWIERGGLLAQPVLEQTSGDATALAAFVPDSEEHDALAAHLRDSVTAYAIGLRDARLNEAGLPPVQSLADLAAPCPTCGMWTDWRGHCNACAARLVQQQALLNERQHLMKERSAEAEERHRLAERLPLALRRMADLEREIAASS